MTSLRNRFRSEAYCSKLMRSWRVNFFTLGTHQSIGHSEQRERMRRRTLILQAAFDLMSRHRAVARIEVGAGGLHALHDRLADLHGFVAKLALDAVGAIVARTPFDGLHRGSRNQLQDIASLQSDVLYPQMTGHVVGALAEGALEIHAQEPGLVPQRQILEGVKYMLPDLRHAGLVRKHQRQLLLEHQHAGGDGSDDVVAALDHREQMRYVPGLQVRNSLQISQLQLGHAAAILGFDQRDFDAVVLEHAHQIESDLGLI